MRKNGFWIGMACALALGIAWFWFGGDTGGDVGRDAGGGDGARGRGGANSARAGRGRRGAEETPPAVTAVAARRGDIDMTLSALGTVTARNTTVVKARVSGLLQRVAFQEGQHVKAGDLLAEIDPRPFRAQLDQAAGQLARDQALLTNARIDLTRYRDLLAKNSIAKQQVDTQAALVRQYEGAVQTNQGSAENARLQLSFTRITAPIDGRLGLRRADVGNMVGPGDADGIVTITQTQPITAVFSLPAGQLGAVLQGMRENETAGTLPVEAWDQDNRTRLADGRLLSIDNQIDTATGTVRLKAEFANTDEALFPNQFVNIRLRVATYRDSILIPSAAVQQGTPGTFVYVVDPVEKKVSVRPVMLGARTADAVSAEKGLAAGEQVVIEGVDSLRDGAKITLIARNASSMSEASPTGKRPDATMPPGGQAPPAANAQPDAPEEAKENTQKDAQERTQESAQQSAPTSAANAVTNSTQERPVRLSGLERAWAGGKIGDKAGDAAGDAAGGR